MKDIQYEKVKWLQNNNPEVPGLVYKLAPIWAGQELYRPGNSREVFTEILEKQELLVRQALKYYCVMVIGIVHYLQQNVPLDLHCMVGFM